MSDAERQQDDGLWEVEDVASYLRVSERTVQRRVAERSIPHVRIGGRVRFRKADIVAWVESLAVAPTDDPDAAVA